MRRLILSWRIVTNIYQEISVKDNMQDNMQDKKAPLDPATIKRTRIEQKSKRIQEKGEAIARKNGSTIPFYSSKEAKNAEPSSKEEPIAPPSPSTYGKSKTKTTTITTKCKNSSFGIAAILAAISIFLLITMFVALTFGLFPL